MHLLHFKMTWNFYEKSYMTTHLMWQGWSYGFRFPCKMDMIKLKMLSFYASVAVIAFVTMISSLTIMSCNYDIKARSNLKFFETWEQFYGIEMINFKGTISIDCNKFLSRNTNYDYKTDINSYIIFNNS